MLASVIGGPRCEWRASDSRLQKRPALVEGALRRGPNPSQRSDRWPGLDTIILLQYVTRHARMQSVCRSAPYRRYHTV